MVNRYVMKSEHNLFIDCLPYEWRSGMSDDLFLSKYPPRSMCVILCFDNLLSWYSHGGLASRQMPQGLSVRVRLLLIGPGAGMRVARASLPRFGAPER